MGEKRQPKRPAGKYGTHRNLLELAGLEPDDSEETQVNKDAKFAKQLIQYLGEIMREDLVRDALIFRHNANSDSNDRHYRELAEWDFLGIEQQDQIRGRFAREVILSLIRDEGLKAGSTEPVALTVRFRAQPFQKLEVNLPAKGILYCVALAMDALGPYLGLGLESVLLMCMADRLPLDKPFSKQTNQAVKFVHRQYNVPLTVAGIMSQFPQLHWKEIKTELQAKLSKSVSKDIGIQPNEKPTSRDFQRFLWSANECSQTLTEAALSRARRRLNVAHFRTTTSAEIQWHVEHSFNDIFDATKAATRAPEQWRTLTSTELLTHIRVSGVLGLCFTVSHEVKLQINRDQKLTPREERAQKAMIRRLNKQTQRKPPRPGR